MKLLLFLVFCFVACLADNFMLPPKQVATEQHAPYYYVGQVIYPDYAHDDTLIVTDPVGLSMALEGAKTDSEINDVLHIYCQPFN